MIDWPSLEPGDTRIELRRATGATFVWVHHCGKDAARGMRGWSGMRAAIDTEIEITETDAGRCAEVTKQRDLPGKGDRFGFRLEVVRIGVNHWHEARHSCVVVSTDAPAKPVQGKRQSEIAGAITVYLRQRGAGMKRSELQNTLSSEPYTWSHNGIRNEVAKMIGDGRLIFSAGVVALPGSPA